MGAGGLLRIGLGLVVLDPVENASGALVGCNSIITLLSVTNQREFLKTGPFAGTTAFSLSLLGPSLSVRVLISALVRRRPERGAFILAFLGLWWRGSPFALRTRMMNSCVILDSGKKLAAQRFLDLLLIVWGTLSP